MAKLTLVRNVFDENDSKEYEINEPITVRKFLESIQAYEDDYSTEAEIFDPETGDTYYETIIDDVESDMIIAVFANGKSQDVDYEIQPSDAVIVEIMPANENWKPSGASILTTLAGIALIAGSFLIPGTAMIAGTAISTYMLYVGIGLCVTGAVLYGFGVYENYQNDKKTTALDDDGEENPSITGSKNQALSDSAFPAVVGKLFVTPKIVGSPYNEFEYSDTSKFSKEWLGTKQPMYLLLAAGYAPLFLKDICLDQLPIATNKARVLNGMLSYPNNDTSRIDDNGNVVTFDGEALPKEIGDMWSSNKCSFEISQFGKNRTLYPKVVKQQSVGASLLYCYDKDYSKVATERKITWQGGTFPCGMRTNTIYFSESVPYKVSVGIDFPSGLYESHSYSGSSSDSHTYYNKIPMNIVVQWRPYYKYVKENGLDSATGTETYYTNTEETLYTLRKLYQEAVDDGTYKDSYYYKVVKTESARDYFVNLGWEVYKTKTHNSLYSPDGDYSEDRYTKWRSFKSSQITIPELTYTNDKIYKFYQKDGVPYEVNGYYGYYQNNTGTEGSGDFFPVQKVLTLEECRSILYKAYIDNVNVKTKTLYITISNQKYNTGYYLYKPAYKKEWIFYGAKTFADMNKEKYQKRQGEIFAKNHPNTSEKTTVQTISEKEIVLNKGLSEGTSYNSNPDWSFVNCFGFGKFSCGENAYSGADPSTMDNPEINKTSGYKDLKDAKDEMHFEVTCELSQEDILDLINRNPMSKNAGRLPANNIGDIDIPNYGLVGNTDVTVDGIEVRVVRLTPCYVNFTDTSSSSNVSYNYNDVVQWSYIKTYCLDKEKLLKDIDSVENNNHFAKINCDIDTFNVTGSAEIYNPTTKEYETVNVEETMTNEGCSRWNKFNISDYHATPLSEEDQYNLCTLGIKVYPDKLGYLSSSLDKVNLTASAITPSVLTSYVRYWYKDNDQYYYCDTYDSKLPSSSMYYPIFSDKTRNWVLDTDMTDEKAESLTKIETTGYEAYLYEVKNNEWDYKVFPEKIENTQTVQLVSDSNGDIQTENGMALLETVKNGNNWFDWAKTEMSRYKDSIGRWIAPEAFVDKFTNQNAIMQALGVMIGKPFGKDAYSYNTYNTDHFVRYWHKDSSLYYTYDVDDTKYNSDHNPTFDISDEKWVLSSESEFLESSTTNISDNNWWSFRTVQNDFNMVALKEAALYTENIDIGGSDGGLSYKCNLYLTSQQKSAQLLQTILYAGRAFWFYDEMGRIEIHNDKPLTTPVLMITDENSLSSSNTRTFERGIAGYHITYNDEENSGQQGEIYVLRNGQTKEHHTRDIKDVTLTGITNGKQAWAMGAYMLGQTITQRESWQRKLNHVGGALTIGSLVDLQSSSLEIGTDTSGRIIQLIDDDDYIYGFIVDNMYEYRAEYNEDGSNVQGCTIMQATSNVSSRDVTLRFANKTQQENGISVTKQGTTVTYKNSKGKTNAVLFEKRIVRDSQRLENQDELDSEIDNVTSITTFKPALGDVVAFGNVGSITSKAVVYQIQPDEKGKVTVSLYPYFDSLYTAGNALPVYKSNITKKSRIDNVPTDSINPEINNNILSAADTATVLATNQAVEVTDSAVTPIKADIENLFERVNAGTLQFTGNIEDSYGEIGKTYTANITDFNRTPVVDEDCVGLDGDSNYILWTVISVTETEAVLKVISFKKIKGDVVSVKTSTPSITFHKRPDDTSNYETYTVTFELYNNGTSVTPENCRVDISNITGNIVVTTSLTENIYTVKVETTYGSSSPSGFIRAYMDYNDESYTSDVTVTSEYSGSYIGAVTELPSSADLGSYFMWNSDTGDYNISCLYTLVQKINEDGTVYTEWVLDNDENHQMTALSDIMSVTDISKNTQAVALIERLVSNNAFIKNLFAEKIDITGNGYIESSNYVSGESGFKISADGNAEFQDGVFNGTVGQSITLATLTEDVTDEETYELDFSSLLDNTKVGSSVLTALTHETINTKSVLFNGIMTKGSDGIYINGNSSSKVVNRSIQKTELMHYPTFILNSLSAGDKIVLHYINIS